MPPLSAGANPLMISTMKIARKICTTTGIVTSLVSRPNAMKLPPTNIRSVTYQPIRRRKWQSPRAFHNRGELRRCELESVGNQCGTDRESHE